MRILYLLASVQVLDFLGKTHCHRDCWSFSWMALDEVDLGRKLPEEHDYSIPASNNLLSHVEYADNVDFICKPNEGSEELLTLVQ